MRSARKQSSNQIWIHPTRTRWKQHKKKDYIYKPCFRKTLSQISDLDGINAETLTKVHELGVCVWSYLWGCMSCDRNVFIGSNCFHALEIPLSPRELYSSGKGSAKDCKLFCCSDAGWTVGHSFLNLLTTFKRSISHQHMVLSFQTRQQFRAQLLREDCLMTSTISSLSVFNPCSYHLLSPLDRGRADAQRELDKYTKLTTVPCMYPNGVSDYPPPTSSKLR